MLKYMFFALKLLDAHQWKENRKHRGVQVDLTSGEKIWWMHGSEGLLGVTDSDGKNRDGACAAEIAEDVFDCIAHFPSEGSPILSQKASAARLIGERIRELLTTNSENVANKARKAEERARGLSQLAIEKLKKQGKKTDAEGSLDLSD